MLNKKNLRLLLPYLLLVFAVGIWMHNWYGQVLPLNLREENVNDLSFLWALTNSWDTHTLFSDWNPQTLTGNTNVIQRGYFLFAPLAAVIRLAGIPVETGYKLAVACAFFLSGVWLYIYLQLKKLSRYASFIGALIFMFLPPHLTLGVDALDFNVFWALIPAMSIVVHYYAVSGKSIVWGAFLGFVWAIGFLAGTTWFISTLPFLLIFFSLQIYLSRKNTLASAIRFYLTAVIFFVGFAAYFILPLLFEYRDMWVSIESQRKRIFNILSFSEYAEMYRLRFTGYPATAWNLHRNHPDIGFYLGTVPLVLAAAALLSIKTRRRSLIPNLFLVLILPGFMSLRWSVVHQGLRQLLFFASETGLIQKIIIVTGTGMAGLWLLQRRWHFFIIKNKKRTALLAGAIFMIFVSVAIFLPRLQSLYDQTFRIFLLPAFAVSVLAAYGCNKITARAAKGKKILLAAAIIAAIMVDLYPFSDYLTSIPLPEALKGKSAYQAINTGYEPGRYFAPFPFKRHLPKYRYEYPTKLITRLRLNNENIYTPFTPLYSTQLYDVLLIGALEEGKIPAQDFITIMQWGFTSYLLLREEVADYSSLIAGLTSAGWDELLVDEDARAFINTKPAAYINVYTNIQRVPENQRQNPGYWIKKFNEGVALYEGERDLRTIRNTVNTASHTVRWNKESPMHINITVSLPTESLLVASEAWYPGWRVRVDEKEKPLLRANFASIGVFVQKGTHQVTFIYSKPWYYTLGWIVTSMSGVTLFLIFRLGRERKVV